MGSFKKFLHHVDIEDVKKKHLEEIAAKKLKEERQKEEKEFIVNTMKEIKYDWRSSLYEKMSTGTAFAYTAAGQPDADVATIDASLETSFGHDQRGVEAHGYSPSGLMGGVAIKPSGSGTGGGGFDIGDHLAFTGDTYNNVRWAALNPIDSTAIDTITITAIRGNDSNGGEDPDAEGEDLEVWYRNADMGQNMWTPINQDPAGNTISGVEKIIIPIGSDSSGLRDWTLPIPAHARTTSTQFMLFQATSSGAEYDHYGVTKISFKRNAPVNVVVSLDDPAASAFIRVGGPAGEESDPKKRKKKINDQLGASDEYTQSQLGDEFPGAGTRVGGDDPFASAEIGDDVKPSPIGKDEVTRSFADFKNLTDKQKINQSDEYIQDYYKTFASDTYSDPESIKLLDLAIQLNPNNINAYYYRTFAYFDGGNYEDALKDTEKILEVDPDNKDIYYIKSMIYQDKGDLELALDELEKAIELNPKQSYLERVKTELEGQIQQEIQRKDVPPDANEEGGVVKRAKYYDDFVEKITIDDTDNQQQISTNLQQAIDLMTTTHYSRGRDGLFSKGAVDLLQEILPLDPDNPEILSNLGVAMLMDRSSSSKEALEHLERAQAIDPSIDIDFGINTWDRYDGEGTQPYSGAKIDRLASLPYRYAREIIKNLPDQSKAIGAKHGDVENYTSRSTEYSSEAKSMSTEKLQRKLVEAARNIETNKYWMSKGYSVNNTSGGGRGRAYNISMGELFGLMQAGMEGEYTGAVPKDVSKQLEKARDSFRKKSSYWGAIADNWTHPQYEEAKAWYNEGGWKSDPDYQYIEDNKHMPYGRNAALRLNALVKGDVEEYEAYYNEYMRRGDPDAIEQIDLPKQALFADVAQEEIVEKAAQDPVELLNLDKKQAEAFNIATSLIPGKGQGADSLVYTTALPFALASSIISGKPIKMYVHPGAAIKIAQDINADELANVLRIDNPVPVTARETIEPSEGKSDKVLTTLFGSQGGLYYNYDTKTKQLFIESRKTLRTTSGGESVTATKGGTIVNFTDIPSPTQEELNTKIAGLYVKFINEYNLYQKDFWERESKRGGVAQLLWDTLRGKLELKADKSKGSSWINPEAERYAWDPKEANSDLPIPEGKFVNNYDLAVAGMKQFLDNNLVARIVTQAANAFIGTSVQFYASTAVSLRMILTDCGVPASDIEKFGGAYGMTWSSTPVNYDDLPDEVKAVIDAAVGTPQGKPDISDYQKKRTALSLDDPIVKDDEHESYKPRGTFMRETTFNKLKKIRKKYDYEGKPSPDGLPENDPPQLDPKTGMHPRYGKNANRYGKLDPISAKAMARVKTGDPETDASVQKQAKKPK